MLPIKTVAHSCSLLATISFRTMNIRCQPLQASWLLYVPPVLRFKIGVSENTEYVLFYSHSKQWLDPKRAFTGCPLYSTSSVLVWDKNYILQYYLDEFQAVMDQAVSRRNFMVEALFESGSVCVSFSVDKVTLLPILSSNTEVFPSLYHVTNSPCSSLSSSMVHLTAGQKTKPRSFQQNRRSFGNTKHQERKILWHFSDCSRTVLPWLFSVLERLLNRCLSFTMVSTSKSNFQHNAALPTLVSEFHHITAFPTSTTKLNTNTFSRSRLPNSFPYLQPTCTWQHCLGTFRALNFAVSYPELKVVSLTTAPFPLPIFLSSSD